MIDARLVERLQASHRILVVCGAGVSTASGIPDFRGPGGVWTRRRPVYYAEFLASEAARVEYWDYKLETWEIYQQAQPNAVHHALVALEHAGKVTAIVTQNVDGLHRRAGTSSGSLIEVHGTDLLVECQTCHETSEPAPHFARFKTTRRAPSCTCGGLLKPATISSANRCARPISTAPLPRRAAPISSSRSDRRCRSIQPRRFRWRPPSGVLPTSSSTEDQPSMTITRQSHSAWRGT